MNDEAKIAGSPEGPPPQPAATVGGLLTPAQAAEFLQVKERLLATWRSNGDGPPYIKMGRIVRYHPEKLENWALSRSRARAAAKEGRL